jgi:hypothetical protein
MGGKNKAYGVNRKLAIFQITKQIIMGKFALWIKIAGTLQILTALVHSMSFFVKEKPSNETEKQLHDLFITYQKDLGAGFHPTFSDIFISLSAGFALLYFFGGLLNWYLVKRINPEIMKGVLNIQILAFGICFGVAAIYTFIMPIIFTGAVFLTLLVARLMAPKGKKMY